MTRWHAARIIGEPAPPANAGTSGRITLAGTHLDVGTSRTGDARESSNGTAPPAASYDTAPTPAGTAGHYAAAGPSSVTAQLAAA